jgi:hypothetical protein
VSDGTSPSIPAFAPVRMDFPRERVGDARAAAAAAAAGVLATAGLRPGAAVAITAGSRGIADIDAITKAVVDSVRTLGYAPFIVPAMGSHGGATSDGQRAVLARYGITEGSMGCAIRSAMETESIGVADHAVETFMARVAWEADAVLIVNRVKPHTDFLGTRESGLTKMLAIGLGKLEGAQACHQHVFDIGLGAAITSASRHILATGKIAGGIAIIENAYHEVAQIVAVPSAGLLDREAELLLEARRLMGRLPLDEIDVLVCDRMGKNISGQGLDTKIIGRSPFGYVQGQPWQPGMPLIRRIVVRDLTPETDGNAMGMGLVDIVPERFVRKVNVATTLINSDTAMTPENAKTPHVVPNDEEAILLALRMLPPRAGGPRMVYVRDTLELSDSLVSDACLPLVAGRAHTTVRGASRPLRFDREHNLISPFEGPATV